MKTSPINNPFLSVIILNYNSGSYLQQCLKSVKDSSLQKKFFEIIIVDNASTDDSIKLAQNLNISNSKYVLLQTNLGFSAGNNSALKHLNPNSTHVLFLNPDTTVNKDTLEIMLDFFQKNKSVDSATCKVILAKTNQIQAECHRGFPTPWRSFCHFFFLEKIFPNNSLFNGYFLGTLDLEKPHIIESCVGAFLMVKKDVGDQIGWWCQEYFMYGEDLDFCYQLHKNNLQLWYTPSTTITHYQGISSGLLKYNQNTTQASLDTRVRSAKATTQAMRIFYKRNYYASYNLLTRFTINQAINLLEFLRITKAKLTK